jgi:hypothetical protein
MKVGLTQVKWRCERYLAALNFLQLALLPQLPVATMGLFSMLCRNLQSIISIRWQQFLVHHFSFINFIVLFFLFCSISIIWSSQQQQQQWWPVAEGNGAAA